MEDRHILYTIDEEESNNKKSSEKLHDNVAAAAVEYISFIVSDVLIKRCNDVSYYRELRYDACCFRYE